MPKFCGDRSKGAASLFELKCSGRLLNGRLAKFRAAFSQFAKKKAPWGWQAMSLEWHCKSVPRNFHLFSANMTGLHTMRGRSF